MAPRGQLVYQDEAIRKQIRILCDDVAKKARGSRQAIWIAIHIARATYRVAYNREPAIVEQPKWPLPDVEELGYPSAEPSYMPRTAKGKGSAGVKKTTMESNAERDQVHSCKYD
ncbi:hypothetical protein L211DRAFT_846106 [Terfezia boudieri ATCC MYA-4762]|uniref:Uncharacterized protein n=1 Tax=Terfezia boudieri ATCC MYA-4762 TaxID=1051890 RepID=A0A3N4LWU4_9PEZI|nr:hypothetical protein L211DRAFT_846106 [Terfezia boudieri ATCC MYA-4762]